MARFSRRTALTGAAALAAGLATQRSFTFAQDAATPAASPVLPVTITDATGAEVTVTDISRIVPLSGDIAEIIAALGLIDHIVGVDLSAVYPEELLALPKIGVERNLNAEGILAVEPTVVIGKEAAGPPPVLEQVKGAGVPVVIISEPQTIEAPVAKITAVAEALGVSDAGAALAESTQASIDEAMALTEGLTERPTAIVLYLQQGGIQLVAGGGTVASAMLEAAGAMDAAIPAGIMGYQPVTSEALVAAAPEIIVTQTLGAESVGGIDGLLEIPGIAETPAGQNGRIYIYDDELLLGMTPRTGEQLMAMIADFHPDLAVATPEA
ncbi:MAG: hemin ABC transporter substrate-binding protein [Thermomicrobiales bacterium]